MTELSPEIAEAVRQRVMHRTSQVEALMYQYGLGGLEAETRYDADTDALAATGVLPDLPPSPDVSGTDEVHDAPDVTEMPEPEQPPEPETVPVEPPQEPAEDENPEATDG